MKSPMPKIQEIYQLILTMNNLKLIFRKTTTLPGRQESTAEHSWSASMITMILMNELKNEFGDINELKALKLSLIHDIVEIHAGDVSAFDDEARKNKEHIEEEALKKLMAVYPEFGEELHSLWYEFEEKETIEAKIAKASDAICPIFQRFQTKQSYISFGLTIANLEKTKYPHFKFSATYNALYQKLKDDLLKEGLIVD